MYYKDIRLKLKHYKDRYYIEPLATIVVCPMCGATVNSIIVSELGLVVEHIDGTKAPCEFVPSELHQD